MTGTVLLGDIGGTNARFAVSDAPGELQAVRSYKAVDYPRFEDALASYIAHLRADRNVAFKAVRIAAAGPVGADCEVALTNSPWRISKAGLRAAVGVDCAELFNDLEAVAFALPHLRPGDDRPIGDPAKPICPGNLLAVNVGTGFGAAIAFRSGEGGFSAIATEAGHMSFSATTEDEAEFFGICRSIEDLLSGDGVVSAYRAFRNAGRHDAPQLNSAGEVFAASRSDTAAARTVATFTRVLARVAGDLVLATGSWGGCYFCGSVVQGWAAQVDELQFRKAFAEKGKMSERMSSVPTRLVSLSDPALFGMSLSR
ncbi:MAG: glucokinase [Alphaproteobacteria bacterium]|nr:glucokinase [Alphaproteobacteria bacterium]